MQPAGYRSSALAGSDTNSTTVSPSDRERNWHRIVLFALVFGPILLVVGLLGVGWTGSLTGGPIVFAALAALFLSLLLRLLLPVAVYLDAKAVARSTTTAWEPNPRLSAIVILVGPPGADALATVWYLCRRRLGRSVSEPDTTTTGADQS